MSSTIKQETAKQDESMKMTETWCGICLIPLTGPHSAKQHYSGGKHKKKACITPSQTSCMNTTVPVTGLCSFDAGLNRGLCQICQIAFTSLDHAQSHFMGSKHKKAVKVYSIQKERSALQEVNAPDNVIRTPSSIAKSTEKLTTSPTETDVSLNMSCRKEEYPVKMMDAWCGICLIPLSGPLQAQQHYNGDKHFKKASSTTQTSYMDLAVPVTGLCSFDEGLNCGSCQICKVAFTSLEHAQAHFSGSKHNKAERLYSALKESSALQDVNAPDNGIPTPSSIVTSMQQTMSAAGIDGGTCNLVMSSSEEDSAGSPMKMTDAWCGVCCIPISSPQTAKQHYSGYKHWKKANCTPSPIRTTDQAVHDIGFHAFDPGQNKNFCQICKIAFTSLEHAQSHLSGSKHNKAERMYSALKGRSALQEVNAPDNGILTSSSMVPSMQQTMMSATVIGGSSLVIPSMEEKADGSPGKMTDSLCGVCCVTFSGPSSAQQHYTSENHRKKAKYMASPIMSMDPAVLNNAIYEFDPVTNRGFCQICQIILTSAQHADSHLKGSKHIKAEQRHTTMIERSSLQPVNITSDDQLLPPERIVKSMEKQTVGELNKLATCSPILNTPHFSQDIMVTSSLATAGRDRKLYRPNNEGKPITQLPFSFPKINLQDDVTIINSDTESQRKRSCNMHVSGDNHSASLVNVDDKFDKDTQLSAPLSALDNKEI